MSAERKAASASGRKPTSRRGVIDAALGHGRGPAKCGGNLIAHRVLDADGALTIIIRRQEAELVNRALSRGYLDEELCLARVQARTLALDIQQGFDRHALNVRWRSDTSACKIPVSTRDFSG